MLNTLYRKYATLHATVRYTTLYYVVICTRHKYYYGDKVKDGVSGLVILMEEVILQAKDSR
jgi:hypothetical protein